MVWGLGAFGSSGLGVLGFRSFWGFRAWEVRGSFCVFQGLVICFQVLFHCSLCCFEVEVAIFLIAYFWCFSRFQGQMLVGHVLARASRSAGPLKPRLIIP